MAEVVFIGDELSAAGFRLSGVDVLVPLQGEAQQLLERAMSCAELVLITEAVARQLDPGYLARCRVQLRPMLGVVPDIAAAAWPENLGAELAGKLGLPGAGR